MKRVILLFLSAAYLVALRPAALPAATCDTIIRVLILKDRDSAAVRIKGPYRMFACGSGRIVKKGLGLFKTAVSAVPGGISVGKNVFKDTTCIRVVPMAGSCIMIGSRSFSGSIDIIRTEEGKISAINRVDVEDYLKGVVQREVPPRWPMAALKAQAIAARTYALYQKMTRQDKDYDLTDDAYSQVYGGRGRARVKTNIAVYLTRGKVLTYNGKIFPAYYHSTCGGRTEDASSIWNIDIEPLGSRRSNFCKESPYYSWECRISSSEINGALQGAGKNTGDIKEIQTNGQTASGRAKEVKIIGDTEMSMPAENFRLLVGPNCVRSTNFTVEKVGGDFVFKGRGFGHGVGMCQWGAYFLAKKRYKAQDILKHYYPKSRIERYETVGF